MKIVGISRGEAYSPNLVGCDAAIFNAVAEALREMNHEVVCISENEMVGFDYTPYDRVFTMARDTFHLCCWRRRRMWPRKRNSSMGLMAS